MQSVKAVPNLLPTLLRRQGNPPSCACLLSTCSAITNFVVKSAGHLKSTQQRWVAVTAGMVGAPASDINLLRQATPSWVPTCRPAAWLPSCHVLCNYNTGSSKLMGSMVGRRPAAAEEEAKSQPRARNVHSQRFCAAGLLAAPHNSVDLHLQLLMLLPHDSFYLYICCAIAAGTAVAEH